MRKATWCVRLHDVTLIMITLFYPGTSGEWGATRMGLWSEDLVCNQIGDVNERGYMFLRGPRVQIQCVWLLARPWRARGAAAAAGQRWLWFGSTLRNIQQINQGLLHWVCAEGLLVQYTVSELYIGKWRSLGCNLPGTKSRLLDLLSVEAREHHH
jgi:hypothetical protein